MSPHARFYLLGLVGLAAALRWPALFANTFHADEALFASWARLIAVWRDPLLQTQLVDKPPLLFYLQALFYPFLGPVEWAARMPNFIASLLLVLLVSKLVWQLYSDEVAALLAATFVALSPFTIQFSATAFTDPLLATLLVAALLTAGVRCQVSGVRSQGRYPLATTDYALSTIYSGLLFGLAVATKYQAWLFLPLLAGLASLAGWQRPQWRRWLLGFLPLLFALLLWEIGRTGSLSLLPAQISGYGGLRPAWSWELWARLGSWGSLWSYVLGSPILAFGLLLSTPIFLALLINDEDRPTALDQLFIIFLLGYFLLHWLLAVPVWDRYLLPAVPVAALIFGRFVSRLFYFARPVLLDVTTCLRAGRWQWLPLLVVLVLQLPLALQAREGRFPIGGRPAADHGAAQIAQFLKDEAYGTVLYDHWFSWHWRYHLFDKGVYVSWFPHPAALVEDLAVFGQDGHARYLVLPESPAAIPVQRALTTAGFQLELVYTTATANNRPSMSLYQVVRK